MVAPTTLPLRCACGSITGAFSALPSSAARGVCHCDDCQAYARFLGRDDVLDARGGTEVVQTWPARLTLTSAVDVRLVRLSAKGLHRFYAGCCRTPLANAFGDLRLPFTGLLRRAIDVDDATLEALYGKGHRVQGRFAPGGCPPGVHPTASLGVVVGAIGILARGWFAGGRRPSPFFTDGGEPVAAARILSAAERAALGSPAG